MNGHKRWQKYSVVLFYLGSMSALAWKPGIDLIGLAAFAAIRWSAYLWTEIVVMRRVGVEGGDRRR